MKKILNLYTIIIILLIILSTLIYINIKIDKKIINEETPKKNKYLESIKQKTKNNEQIKPIEVEQNKEIEKVLDEKINETNKLLQNYNQKDNNKIKQNFLLITDFIFYNKEINGKTFKDIKENEKERILSSWNQLNKTITEKHPKLIEEIKKVTKNNYNNLKNNYQNLKDKLINKYNNKISEETKQKTKEKINNIKENVKTKEEETRKKISSWYEKYKEVNG